MVVAEDARAAPFFDTCIEDDQPGGCIEEEPGRRLGTACRPRADLDHRREPYCPHPLSPRTPGWGECEPYREEAFGRSAGFGLPAATATDRLLRQSGSATRNAVHHTATTPRMWTATSHAGTREKYCV